ncbi:MAG: hypothetical protein A2V88_05025 [Elusimicrobia bacterium RBG_16_66_12]|nr:MAG: hypothetical protein A2V88_05025 [Elusimicrobia bacterium RBG_16_66_12]
MSYGYDSSTPNLTLNIRPADFATLQRIARDLGFRQTRGATAGQGSASALLSALSQAAADAPAAAARHLTGLTPQADLDEATREDHRFIVADVDALRTLARRCGFVTRRGPGKKAGQGSITSLVASIAQSKASAARLTWIKHRPTPR